MKGGGVLVRHYIGEQLGRYYAQPSSAVVGSVSKSIPFSYLLGEWHWKWIYRRLYAQQRGQWLTPVELFRPHYSQVVANFVAAQVQPHHESFRVVELGGGRATNASLVLQHLHQHFSQLFHRLQSYTIVDSSPTLAQLQKEVLSSTSPVYQEKVHFLHKSLQDIVEGDQPCALFSGSEKETAAKSKTLTVVVALELLDNLPHDKVCYCRKTNTILQAELSLEQDETLLQEVFVPLQDPHLRLFLDTARFYAPSRHHAGPVWIPTIAGLLLHRLLQHYGASHVALLLADFDWLPPPDTTVRAPSQTAAGGEPLVTSMQDLDYACYLDAARASSSLPCDYLFATNFDQLWRLVQQEVQHQKASHNTTTRVWKQSQFLQHYGPAQVRATQSILTGYTPLLHDFYNCSVLTMTTRGANKGKD